MRCSLSFSQPFHIFRINFRSIIFVAFSPRPFYNYFIILCKIFDSNLILLYKYKFHANLILFTNWVIRLILSSFHLIYFDCISIHITILIGSRFTPNIILKDDIKMRKMCIKSSIVERNGKEWRCFGYMNPQIGSRTIYVGFDFKC